MSSSLLFFALIIITVLFATFINGYAGIFILTAIISAEFLTALMARIISGKITLTVKTDEKIIKNKSTFTVYAVIKSNSFLPLSSVVLSLKSSENIFTEAFPVMTKVITNSTISIPFKYTGVYGGKCFIRKDEFYTTDIFSFLKFNINVPEVLWESYILYEKSECQSDVLSTELIIATDFLDNEMTTERELATQRIPGYEHRDYIPGDSLKKVDFKASAKHDKLLVRKDEFILPEKQAILLMNFTDNTVDKKEIYRENTFISQAALSLADFFIKNKIPIVFFYAENSEMKAYISDENENSLELYIKISDCDIFKRKPEFADFNSYLSYNINSIWFFYCSDDKSAPYIISALRQKFKVITMSDKNSDYIITSDNNSVDFTKGGV